MPLNLSKKDEGAKNMWGNWASFYRLIGGLGENAGEQGEIGQAEPWLDLVKLWLDLLSLRRGRRLNS